MRARDWQERLEALVMARLHVPFAWGRVDCCLFAADAVHALTGTDPAAPWRGTYSDERGALRLVQSLGGLAAIAELHCGMEVDPARARPGDIVLGRVDRECLGVCTGATWHAPSAAGLVARPMAEAQRAWRV
jgi:hypothetical protein